MTEGDRLWFEEQIRDAEKAMYNVAYTIVGNHTDAEDAVCDALLSAWQSFSRLHDRTYFRAWLIKIVKNRSYDMLRKRKEHLEYDDALMNSPPDEDDDMERAERELCVHQAIMQLPDEQRLAITLFYMENFSIKEIAKITKSTEGTIKSRLSRARVKLRELLGGENDA